MNINEELEIQPRLFDPASIATIGSAVVGAFGAIENTLSNVRSREYLQAMANDISQMKIQLATVLSELDELPVTIRNIIKEEVSLAMLSDKYIELESIEITAYSLMEDSTYVLSERAWYRSCYLLRYICNCENRLSYIPDFVRACEIIMFISNSGGKDIVLRNVEDKYNLIESLYKDLKQSCIEAISELTSYLNHPEFIKSYYFDEVSLNVDGIKYTPLPDKNTVETYSYKECYWVTLPAEGEISDKPGHKNPPMLKERRCVTKTGKRTVDSAVRFNHDKNEHIIKIEAFKSTAKLALKKFRDVSAVIELLDKYRSKLILQNDLPLVLKVEENFTNFE